MSAAERILKWISVGLFSLRCSFAFLLLSDLDEGVVTLVLEIDKDSDSVLRFERVSNGGGIIEDIVGAFAVGPPTRVLVPCPASLLQSSCKELIDARACVSIGLDMVGAEVILEDVPGHAVAIVNCGLLFWSQTHSTKHFADVTNGTVHVLPLELRWD